MLGIFIRYIILKNLLFFHFVIYSIKKEKLILSFTQFQDYLKLDICAVISNHKKRGFFPSEAMVLVTKKGIRN